MIRVGIGGWTFEPWRGTFYPSDLKQARELEYASRQLTSIEVNGTFYATQKPATYRKWADETPDDFVFSLKGPRYAVNRRVLAEAGDSIERFLTSGITELGTKLGPLLWQFAGTKKLDLDDFEGFLRLLPKTLEGQTLMHVVEVRHDSFCVPEFIALVRRYATPVVYADSEDYPAIADVTGDFVYARLQRSNEKHATGYSAADIAKWAKRFEAWAEGGAPADLPLIAKAEKAGKPRPVFVYMIAGAKVRAPVAAMALIKKLDQ